MSAFENAVLVVGDRVRNVRGTFGKVVGFTRLGGVRVVWDGMAPDTWVVYRRDELALVERGVTS